MAVASNSLIWNPPSGGGGGGGGSIGNTGGSGGIDYGPIRQQNFIARYQKPKPPQGPNILDQIRQQYGSLASELDRLTNQYRQDIGRSTGYTVDQLSGVDPLAAYRVTAPTLQAPTASAASYLSAIGANPAQVEAQRDFMNQMMQSQTASQSDYSQALDQSQQAYRQAQIAEVLRNANEANAALSAASIGQRSAVGLKQLEAEQAIKQALLDYQLQLLLQEPSRRTGQAPGIAFLPFGDLTGTAF